jgi:hypothetical protein
MGEEGESFLLNVSSTRAFPHFASPSEAIETTCVFKRTLESLIALSAVSVSLACSSADSFLQLPEMRKGLAQ